MFAAIIPPTIAHAQQQMLGMFTKGIAERIPRITPPINAGFILSFMSVYTFTRGDRKTLVWSFGFTGGSRRRPFAPPPDSTCRANTRVTPRGEVRAGRAASRG